MRERCGRCKNPWDGTEVLWWGHYPGGKGGVKTMVMVADIDDVLRGWRWENRRIVEEEREKGWELVECDWCGLKWKGGVEFGKHRKTCGGLFARIAANFA